MRAWLIAFVVCALATAIVFAFVDVPVATFFHEFHRASAIRVREFRIPALIGCLGLAFLFVGLRSFGGRPLDTTSETIVLAALALALTMSINEFVLKPFFGRPTPHNFFKTGHSFFGWLRDVHKSSFPSGHAAQMASVGAVLWTRYRRWRAPVILVVFLLCAIMIIGGWHFVSDLIAGAFLGVFCAAILQSLWQSRPADRVK
ncbi:MAG TPA: phosphatase PAP2 family protein [Rhizomicrobium sp.]|jgi:membrane-associated phospholipid phosphatase